MPVLQPDVILTDLGLPGVEGIARLRERVPAIPILALTVHDGDDKVFAALGRAPARRRPTLAHTKC